MRSRVCNKGARIEFMNIWFLERMIRVTIVIITKITMMTIANDKIAFVVSFDRDVFKMGDNEGVVILVIGDVKDEHVVDRRPLLF